MYCPNCGSKNNDNARFCYKCGQLLSGTAFKRNIKEPSEKLFTFKRLIIAILIVFVLLSIGLFFRNGDKPQLQAVKNNIIEQKKEDNNPQKNIKLSYSSFNKLEIGMNYQNVVKIIGSKGKLTKQKKEHDSDVKTYEWQNKTTHLTCSFQNEKLVAKSMESSSNGFSKSDEKNFLHDGLQPFPGNLPDNAAVKI
ncbi:zinc-ribbon domain-containing protein [Pectinatus sottacetonis]|uniref:zinc-ribbon domain-containing protein n=1 Tax=Pectinatus sottacetonis TaxID=1002795 RepID=UPI0018C45C7F|nr:zinc ribbon domain-containing protein [Pectinatus sottacetonis]